MATRIKGDNAGKVFNSAWPRESTQQTAISISIGHNGSLRNPTEEPTGEELMLEPDDLGMKPGLDAS